MTENVAPAQTPEAGARPRGFIDLRESILEEFAERAAYAVEGRAQIADIIVAEAWKRARDRRAKGAS